MLILGTDSYNHEQLGYAYAAAAALDFKVFLSFDFSYWGANGNVSLVWHRLNWIRT